MLFAGSTEGAHRACVLLGIIATCRTLDVKALQMAPVSRVAPIDKASLAFTILFVALLLGEHISWRMGLGPALMIAGAVLTVLK